MAGVTPSTVAGRLNRVQSFKETIWGTVGQATARWMGIIPTPTFTPIFKSEFFDENRGSFAPSFVSYVPESGGAWGVEWNATFEDIIFALHGILGAVSPTGGDPYTYTYAAPLTTAWSPQSYALELHYDIATLVAKGCLTNKVGINFAPKKNWGVSQSGFFQVLDKHVAKSIVSSTNASPIEVTITAHGLLTSDTVVIVSHTVNTAANGSWTIIKTGANTFTLTGSTGNGVGGATGTATQGPTGDIADRTVEPILFAGETTLTVDAAAVAPGTTPVSNALVGGSIDIENALAGFFTGDQKYPVDFTQDKLKVSLSVKLKWNAQVKALYDTYWAAGSRTVWQIKATSGSKSVEIDFAGVLSSDPQNYGLDYGATTQEFKFDAQYDTGALANYLKIIVINSVSTIP